MFINLLICITGRATLQNWSLILYGTKLFESTSPKSNDFKVSKPKSTNLKKKNPKKQKTIKNNLQKNFTAPDKSPKIHLKSKLKDLLNATTANYNLPVYVLKNKKTKATTEISPYFYSVNSSRFKGTEDGVKPYLKFVKNITITYPVMIPARENVKSRDSFKTKQKQKEKSRDLNSNRNLKIFPPKSVAPSTFTETSPPIVKEKVTGN